jgi:hypothetical protein
MKYYQAVYQTDSHGFHVVYSKNIWTKEEDAREYLYELSSILHGESGSFMYESWVRELYVNTP